jgi:hypothetical protein
MDKRNTELRERLSRSSWPKNPFGVCATMPKRYCDLNSTLENRKTKVNMCMKIESEGKLLVIVFGLGNVFKGVFINLRSGLKLLKTLFIDIGKVWGKGYRLSSEIRK